MAKSKARYLADILQSDGSSTFVGDFSVPASFTIDPEGSPGGTVTIAGDIVSTGPTGLDNASLQNDSITINSYVTDLGTSLTLDTDDIQESSPATNIWFTQARARESISLTDNGGDGSLSYNNTTGEFSFTGPSAAEVRAHFSSGTGVTLSSGQISIGQSVATSDNVTFVGVTGTGSSSFDTLSVTNTATIPYDNSISGLTATTVQSAISEINNLLGGGNVGSQASFDSYEFTATTNQTTFDLANLGLSPTPSYIAGYIQVFLNGVLLAEADYTATDGQTIVLSSGAEAGDILTVTVLDSFDIANLLRVTSIDASASTNSITLDANDDLSLTGSLSFADNEKAIFGAGSDLQIFHVGGSASYVETATNDLYLKGFRDVYLQTSGANSVIAVGGGATTLLHNGSAKLATTSTGVDVTGTVTADGLTVDGQSLLQFSNNGRVTFRAASATDETQMHVGTNNSGALNISTRTLASDVDRIKLANNGDISFYDSAGSNPKFFWDASAEWLGIGTTNVDVKLHIAGSSASTLLKLERESVGGTMGIDFNAGNNGSVFNNIQYGRIDVQSTATGGGVESGAMTFHTRNGGTTAERMRIESDGALNLLGAGLQVDGQTLIDTNGAIKSVGAETQLAKTYNLTTTGSFSQWIRLGTFNTSQSGRSIHFRFVARSGYNANNAQTQMSELKFGTSNNSSAGTALDSSQVQQTSVFFGDAQYYKYEDGNSAAAPSDILILQKSNSSYEFWGLFGSFVGTGSFFVVSHNTSDAFIYSGTTQTAFPTIGASEYYVQKSVVGIQNNSIVVADSSGNITIPDGAGIVFADAGATGNPAPSATGNTLDEYEEGTWTPNLRDSAATTTYSYSNGYGKYVRVGSQVTVHATLTNISGSIVGSGYFVIENLPFSKVINHQACGSVRYENLNLDSGANTGNTSAVIQFTTSAVTNILYIRALKNNSAGVDVNVSGLNLGNTDITFSITYTAQ